MLTRQGSSEVQTYAFVVVQSSFPPFKRMSSAVSELTIVIVCLLMLSVGFLCATVLSIHLSIFPLLLLNSIARQHTVSFQSGEERWLFFASSSPLF